MTDTTIVTLASAALAAIPPTLMALAALITARRNATALRENTALTGAVRLQTELINQKADVIYTQTNGRLTQLMSELGAANERIARLDKTIIEMGQERQITAERQDMRQERRGKRDA